MKHRRFSAAAFLAGVLVSCAVSFSAVMCPADCFDMPCHIGTLLMACVGFSLLAGVVFSLQRSWAVTAIAAVIYSAVLFCFRQPLLTGLETAVYCITKKYALCFSSVKVFGTSSGTCTGILTLLALPLAWITSWVVHREGSAVLISLICAPILVLCLIIVDLAPIVWLIVLTGALLLLLLTNGVREQSSRQGGQLMLLLTGPVALLMGLLIVVSPPQDYQRTDWIQRLQVFSEQLVSPKPPSKPTPAPNLGTPWISALKTVDLNKVGPMRQTHIKVLEYTADTAIDYLRGVSLGVYSNNTWTAVPQSAFLAEDFDPASLMTVSANSNASVTIRTVGPGLLLYTPYNMTQIPGGGTPVDDAYVENTAEATRYTIPYAVPPGDAVLVSPGLIDRSYEDYVNRNYTHVPEELLQELLAIVQQEGLDQAAGIRQRAAAVEAYVKHAAVYDLNTPAVPDGKDFILYFLNESKQGYCVHFASAAAMLLRAMDIPTRYVTGYGVWGPAGEVNAVTTDQSHAWVEYYVNGIGWMSIDPTPPDWTQTQPEIPEPDEPEPPEVDPVPDEPEPPEPEPPEETPDEPKVPTVAPKPNAKPKLNLGPWLWLLTIPGTIGLVLLRRSMILSRKRKFCLTGHMNRRCMHCWRQIAQISRITGNRPAQELVSLAEKARFSQHTMTEEEFGILAQAAHDHTDELKQATPFFRKLWHKYGLCLY
jgi:transglutaminase-like putative cysteine protease